MTSSTTNPPSNIAGRELNLIASSFVKQYYTLLNKAPCYIHNFYSQSSTFIHGTVEVANEHFTEPIVGREKIQSKMEEMKLNDCRAKIKQIDCLETLAGGLVIQVIGELSNNGRPMRPFMQTFVLAPSPDEARQDGKDPSHQRGPGANDPRRGAHVNENNSSPSNNQKFFVLNSIFRYQDDGLDSESEDDVVGIQANTSIERSNNAGEHLKEARKSTHVTANAAQPSPPVNSAATAHVKNQQTPIMNETESRRTDVSGGGGSRIVPNGTGSNDKKTETSEKSTENGKPTLEQSSQQSTTSSSSAQGVQPPASISSSAATSQSKPINTTATTTTTSTPTNATAAPRPQPSSEPKTWANMVSRNAHPPPASVPSTASATKTLHPDQQHQNQPSHQLQQSQQQQQQSHHQHQTQSDQQQNTQSNNNPNNSNNNNNNNNRRRHMIRKPSNKSNGGGSAGGGGGGSGTGGGGRGDGRGEGRIDGRGDGRGDGGPRLKNNRDRPRPPPAGKPMA